MENFLKNNISPFLGGGITITAGLLTKYVFKKEIINVSNPQKIVEEFLLVSLAGIIAKEILKEEVDIHGTTPWNPHHYPDKKGFTPVPNIKPSYPKLHKASAITNTTHPNLP